MGMASLLPGAGAICEIPQIDVSQWPSPGSIKAMEDRILRMTFDEFRVLHPEMVDVRARFVKSGIIPPFLIVSNETDLSIKLQKELMHFVGTSRLRRIGRQELILVEKVSGHYSLPQEDALALIAAWSEQAGLQGEPHKFGNKYEVTQEVG